MDAMQLPKFEQPGDWATGRAGGHHRPRGAGKVYVVSVVDDHSRLAYSELHSNETGQSVTATLRRAAAWMREQGCNPVEAVMTDNHKAYSAPISKLSPTPPAPATSQRRPTRPAGTASSSA